jgi:hypothetical protein
MHISSCRLDGNPLQQLDNNAAAVSQPSTHTSVTIKPEPAAAAPAPTATSLQQEQQQPQQSASKSVRQKQAAKKLEALDSDSDGTATQDGKGVSKRRRRIRNAKQQELNRLAQQRYRWVTRSLARQGAACEVMYGNCVAYGARCEARSH